jgi:hypothetical protein
LKERQHFNPIPHGLAILRATFSNQNNCMMPQANNLKKKIKNTSKNVSLKAFYIKL